LVLAYGQTFVQLRIKIALPLENYRQTTPRSRLALKGINISAGIINADYQEEIQAIVINYTNQPFAIYTRNRIAQLIVKRIAFSILVKITSLDYTLQKINGFSSTKIATIDLSLCETIVKHISKDTLGQTI
jgi:dUTP pyrophosphatase